MVLNDSTLVLNRFWVPVDVTSVFDALCKLYAGVARVVHPEDGTLHDFDSWASLAALRGQPVVRTARLTIPAPEIIVLARYGAIPERGVPFSRRNLFQRDGYTCQYCGGRPGSEALTIDHVIPRALGGTSSWTNCVLACLACNRRKANRGPRDAGLTLIRRPLKPKWSPRLLLARVTRKASWEKFVSEAYWNVELQA